MDAMDNKIYYLGDFTVFTDINEIEYKGKRTKLKPKEMGVLHLLLDNKNSTVTRADFLSKVWGDDYGNDQGLTQAISRLRGIFSKSREVTIRTIPKKGYQLISSDREIKSFQLGGLRAKASTMIIVVLASVIGYLVFFRPVKVRIQVRKEIKSSTSNSKIISNPEKIIKKQIHPYD